MKKVIVFNIIITLFVIPYAMQRWLEMPYVDGCWNIECLMLFSFFALGIILAISNVLMLLSMRWQQGKLFFLKGTTISLALMIVYPVYAGVVVGYNGGNGVYWDILAILILCGNIRLSNKVYQDYLNKQSYTIVKTK